MQRRSFLRTAAATPVVGPLSGTPSATATSASAASGVVWSHREPNPGTQRLFDVIRGDDAPYLACGYGRDGDYERTVVRTLDRAGREESQRRGPEWGTQGHCLLDAAERYLLAGVDEGAPLLVGFESLSDVVWRRTYDGAPHGGVHAATTGSTHAVGWTERGDAAGARVVGVDDGGAPQWRARLDGGRRLTGLVATEAGTAEASGPVFVAVGRGREAGDWWATVRRPDGTRVRELSLDLPGPGPDTVAADGASVLLAGTTAMGWWLQRRAPDWTVDWTRSYTADSDDPGVDDVVVRETGYGVLAHDSEATAVLRIDDEGSVRWRGRYSPYTDSGTESDDGTPAVTGADRGHAMVPVGDDQFVLVGATAPGAEGRDWWTARVGEPGTVDPTTPTAEGRSPTPTGGMAGDPVTATRGERTDGERGRNGRSAEPRPKSGSDTGPGSVVWAAVAAVGLGGWYVLEHWIE